MNENFILSLYYSTLSGNYMLSSEIDVDKYGNYLIYKEPEIKISKKTKLCQLNRKGMELAESILAKRGLKPSYSGIAIQERKWSFKENLFDLNLRQVKYAIKFFKNKSDTHIYVTQTSEHCIYITFEDFDRFFARVSKSIKWMTCNKDEKCLKGWSEASKRLWKYCDKYFDKMRDNRNTEIVLWFK